MAKRANSRKGRTQLGCFSIEGLRLHERALHAGIPMRQILVSQQLANQPTDRERRLLAQIQRLDYPITMIPDEAMTELTKGRGLGSIIGLAQLPHPLDFSAWLADIQSKSPKLTLLIGVDLEEPGNVGALIRTGHGLGADAFALVGKGDPYHPKAVRTSMGSLFKMPLFQIDKIAPFLALLKDAGIRTIGSVAQGGIPLPQLKPVDQRAIFLGSEYLGLPPHVTEQLDILTTVPMAAGIDSLSVNVAAAALLYGLRH